MKLKNIFAASVISALLVLSAGTAVNNASLHSDSSCTVTAYSADLYDTYDYEAAAEQAAENVDRYDDKEETERSFNPVSSFIISFVIALIIAFIVVGSMKSKLKTVRQKTGASDYKVDNSLSLREQTDTYMYKKVEKTRRAQSGK